MIKEKIEEIKNCLSPNQIDHQLILAFSLNYNKIRILAPYLSKSTLESSDFIHFDQELLYHLLTLDISFPILPSLMKHVKKTKSYFSQKLTIEKNLYEELQKRNKIEEIEHYCKEKGIKTKIREKTKIEEIIEKDDIEAFKALSTDINFAFNQTIKKDNELFHYSRIPIILYCIEKNAYKCFKFALINGADPTIKSERMEFNSFDTGKKYVPVWDAYGFASAKGNIQILRILEESGFHPTNCINEGCSKFHQKLVLDLMKKEKNDLLNNLGIIETICYENFEALELFCQEKGANINARDIIYLKKKMFFLIKKIRNQ